MFGIGPSHQSARWAEARGRALLGSAAALTPGHELEGGDTATAALVNHSFQSFLGRAPVQTQEHFSLITVKHSSYSEM
jgi:hypothetical protein